MRENRFENKIVLVTGGNSGIGLATAIKFAQEGATVVITGRNPKTLESAAAKIGPRAIALRADVSVLKDIDLVYREIKEKFGRLDVLFVNAGIAKLLPLEEITEEIYDTLMGVNVKGAFFTMQKALPLLTDGASIVINASVADSNGRPGQSIYGASKAAVRSMARSFSAELIKRRIRVNVVSPGPIETPIFENIFGAKKEKVNEIKQQLKEGVPMKRFGTPEEIAAAVTFLASSEASFILGVELYVDGGKSQL